MAEPVAAHHPRVSDESAGAGEHVRQAGPRVEPTSFVS